MLSAFTVKVNVPPVVGVPVKPNQHTLPAQSGANARPGGNAPEDTDHVQAFFPGSPQPVGVIVFPSYPVPTIQLPIGPGLSVICPHSAIPLNSRRIVI